MSVAEGTDMGERGRPEGLLDDELLLTAIEALLAENPAGIKEHRLLQELAMRGFPAFGGHFRGDELALFRVHFVLFNALYRLRDQLWEQARGHLEITLAGIKLCAYQAADSGLAMHDPMRDYYLDLEQLRKTTGEDVQALLRSFWERFEAHESQHEALAVLGLTPPVDLPAVRARHRQLALEHHPDQGGSTERMREINAAVRSLERVLSPS